MMTIVVYISAVCMACDKQNAWHVLSMHNNRINRIPMSAKLSMLSGVYKSVIASLQSH